MRIADRPDTHYRPHCNRCGTAWEGLAPAHCGACHRTFSTVGNFETHRVDDTCVEPGKVQLAYNADRGMWQKPSDPNAWWNSK